MVRSVDPKKNKNRQTTTENAASENHAIWTKYVLVPEEKFKARLKYALKKYDAIWKSLADK